MTLTEIDSLMSEIDSSTAAECRQLSEIYYLQCIYLSIYLFLKGYEYVYGLFIASYQEHLIIGLVII